MRRFRSVPWITDDAVRFICGYIAHHKDVTGKGPRILEFGMGESTLFFAEHASELVSFEHDPDWHQSVSRTLEVAGATNVETYIFERPYSLRLGSTVKPWFNIVLIDGRDRVACLEETIRLGLLDDAGIIVLDNTERVTGYNARYGKMLELLRGYSVIHFEQRGPDRVEWLAPHRWITSIAWLEHHNYTTTGDKL